ncbi:hypothetical protein U1Q18_029135 [Sarracenia purpurea var. burkii]
MASRSHPSLSLTFTASAIVALFVVGGVEARFKGISPWCRTSDYKLLCTKMVNGATTKDAAIANAINSTLGVTLRTTPLLNGLAAVLSDLPNVTRDSVVTTCKDNYGTAVDNLGQALGLLNTGDQSTIVDRIQTAETLFSECTDAIKQMDPTAANSTLARTGNILFKFSSNCLAVATQV